MTLPAASLTLTSTVQSVQGTAANVKAQAQNALISLQTTAVSAVFIFQMLDVLGGVITQLNIWKAVPGLDSFATTNIPGYAGTLSADITTTVNAAQACINWVVANFPVDAGGFLQAFKLNADGTRVPTTFTSSQTTGLQTLLQTFIQTIG